MSYSHYCSSRCWSFRRKSPPLSPAALAFLSLGSYFSISQSAGSYGWTGLFRATFYGGLSALAGVPDISIRLYVSQWPIEILKMSLSNIIIYLLPPMSLQIRNCNSIATYA